MGRTSERIARIPVAAFAQQSVNDARKAVHGCQMQGAHAAMVLRVEIDAFTEQSLQRRHQHILVATGTRLGACT